MYAVNKIETFHPAHGRGHESSRTLLIFCLLITVLLCLTAATNTASAATYYLDAVNGNDTNPGTSTEPWETLAKAKSVATYGDTVLLRDGNYGDFTDSRTTSGTDWLTYKAAPGHTPVLGHVVIGTQGSDSYIEVDGLHITDRIQVKGAHVNIKNCDVQSGDWLTPAIDGGSWGTIPYGLVENCNVHNAGRGVLAGGDYWTIRNNKVHYICEHGIRGGANSHALVEDNEVWNVNPGHDPEWIGYPSGTHAWHADGIFWYLPSVVENLTIRNNIVHSSRIQGGGAIFISTAGTGYKNIRVENNLIYNIDGAMLLIGADDLYVNNNTFIDNGPSLNHLSIYSDAKEVHNNIFSQLRLYSGRSIVSHGNNIFAQAPTSFTLDASSVVLSQAAFEALFTDYDSNDFTLVEGSSAIGFGNPDYGPSTDILGNPRDAAPDAGCYEYMSQSLVADAGPDQTVTDSDDNGSEQVTLDGSGSSDSNGTIVSYVWTEDGNQIATGSGPTVTLLVGEHTITLTVTDDNDLTDTDTVLITVEGPDETAPHILSVSASETSVEITFSESLDITSATNIANYNITGDITVQGASLNVDTVTLTTSAHTEGTYTLTVENVQDTSGNPMIETTTDYEYDDGLVAHWKFDDGSGNSALDSSGNNNTGTLINGPTWTTGRFNGGLSFDGVDDAVEIGTAGLNSGSGTIALWSYAISFTTPDGQYLFGHTTQPIWSNRIQLYTDDPDGYLNLGLGDSHTSHTQIHNLDIQSWYHIALTWDGSNYTVYVDGSAQATGAYSGLSTLETYADIGNTGNRADRTEAFHGIIDEVRIYNRALVVSEILDLYNEGTIPDTNAPVISNLDSSNISSSGATITWDTDENSTSQVEYGLDTNYGSATNLDSSLVTSHSVLLTGLSQSTTYHFRVKSADTSGNESTSGDNTFTTSGVTTYTLNITALNGSVTKTPDQASYGNGTTVTLQATANTDYSFASWSGDASGTSNPTTVVMDGNKSVTANFINTYTLDITATNGSVAKTPDQSSYDHGTMVTLQATANAGYTFASWSGDASGTSNPTTVVMDGNKSVTANFTINTYTLDITATNGSVAKTPDQSSYDHGTTVTLQATANAGYTFASWSGDASGTSNPTTVVMDGNKSITTNFTVGPDETAPTVTILSPRADFQAHLNTLVTLDITDSGDGVDANSVEIEVNGETVYSGNTTTYGDCHRIGTKARYIFIYQSNELCEFDQTINVTVNATDLAANNMDPCSYSFDTEMRSFGENKILHSGSNNENWGPLTTVCDGSGNIWIAWPQGVVGSRDIYVGKLVAGIDSFVNSGVVQVTKDNYDQGNPVIAIDSSDKLYLAWQDNRQGEWDIYVSTSTDGIDWSIEKKVTDPNSNQINPAIAVDSSDKVYIAWEDDPNSNKEIFIASSTDSFVTKTTIQITSAVYDQTTPDIAIDSDDTVYVVWTDTRNTGGAPNPKNDIYGAASNSGSWTNIPIVTKEDSQSRPAIATEAVGSILHLVWVDDRIVDANDDIFYAKTTGGLPGSPLTGSSIIDDTTDADQISPVIITTGYTGNELKVFACWRDERWADVDLYLADINSEGDYGANVFVGDDGTSTDQSEPAIGIDGYGQPYIVWINERTDICYAGSTFIEPTALASVTAPVSTTTTVGTAIASIADVDDASAVIPAGAYLCDMDVTISRIRNPHKPPSNNRTFLYEFGPSGTTFSEPVTITIPYNATTLVSSPSAYWYNPLTGLYSQEGITNVEVIQISSGLYALRFKTTHFSIFGGGGPFAFGGGGGGGGGCSMSPNSQDGIVELLLPYIGLAVVMVVLKLRDRRKRKAHNIAKS